MDHSQLLTSESEESGTTDLSLTANLQQVRAEFKEQTQHSERGLDEDPDQVSRSD